MTPKKGSRGILGSGKPRPRSIWRDLGAIEGLRRLPKRTSIFNRKHNGDNVDLEAQVHSNDDAQKEADQNEITSSASTSSAKPSPLQKPHRLNYALVRTQTSTLSEISELFHATFKHAYPLPPLAPSTSTETYLFKSHQRSRLRLDAIKLLARWENTMDFERTGKELKGKETLELLKIGQRAGDYCWCTYGALGLRAFGRESIKDLQGTYFPVGAYGPCHLGILRAAQWIIDHHLHNFPVWLKKTQSRKILCVGHSLGAGTATILTLLLNEQISFLETESGLGKGGLEVRCYGFGSPPVVSKEWGNKYGHLYTHYLIPHLCYGTVLEFKSMIAYAAELICTQDARSLSVADVFALLEKRREELRPQTLKTVIPGRLVYLYPTSAIISSKFEEVGGTEEVAPEGVSYAVEEGDVHIVVEEGVATMFDFFTLRDGFIKDHMPWEYEWALKEAARWVEFEDRKERSELREGEWWVGSSGWKKGGH
ncbi:hypothetical protein HDV05_007017 [Chytridiales sp. JEL 0842]|nr:hypothetical protein HDV05_007017 [Chytridiales sp. JEL 0842]